MSRKNFIFISLSLSVVFLIAFVFFGEEHPYPLKSSIGVSVQLVLITSALETFLDDMKRYPSNEENLDVLINPPPRNSGLWKGPYIDGNNKFFQFSNGDITRDVWGERFRYFYCSCPTHPDTYRIYSYGKNKKNDFGEKDDITTWKDIDKSYYQKDYLRPTFFWSKVSKIVVIVIPVCFVLLVAYYLVRGKK